MSAQEPQRGSSRPGVGPGQVDVELTPADDERAHEAARRVNANKARLGKDPHLFGANAPGTDVSRYQSFRAELAVARYLGADEPEWSVYAGGDGKIDLTLPDGRTVQVKWRSERKRDLATDGLDFHEELVADVYVLVWPGQGDALTLVGWATRDDFIARILARHPVRMFGKKWELRWNRDLRPMPELFDALREIAAADDDELTRLMEDE